jgi:hypothetical protein
MSAATPEAGQAVPGLAGENRLHRSLSILIAVAAVLARAWVSYTTHATGEDFLITLRYAEHIATGHGFVYNPGEHVLGSTTPLYTLLLALAACCHLDAAIFGKALNILADGLTCLLLYRLLAHKNVGHPMAGLFAAALYAFGSTPISISISGMETALVTCAGLAAVLAYVEDRPRPLMLLSAMLFLLRIDTLLLTTLLIVGLALRRRHIPWSDLGLAVLLILPWLLFAFWYFGSPVPTSLVAKLTVYRGSMGASRADILGAFSTQFVTGELQKALTLLFVIGAVHVVRRRDANLAVPLLWLLLYYGIMLTSHVPAFGWYFLPPWPIYLALATLGAQQIGGYLVRFSVDRGSVPEPVFRQTALVALALVALLGVAHIRSIRRDIAAAQALEDRVRMPLGLWFRDHARPNERILLEPIGTIGYYSQRPILDMIGLVSPEVFPSYRTPTPLADIVRRLHPDWLCLRPNEAERLRRAAPELLSHPYHKVRDFRAPNQTIAFLIFFKRPSQ